MASTPNLGQLPLSEHQGAAGMAKVHGGFNVAYCDKQMCHLCRHFHN